MSEIMAAPFSQGPRIRRQGAVGEGVQVPSQLRPLTQSSTSTLSFSQVPVYRDERDPRASISVEEHRHWCTICENPAPMTTCDGWKRHEIEMHERYYVCMPDGAVEVTDQGSRCIFCALLNPDQKHLDTHDIHSCLYKTLPSRRYARRGHFIKHLESHGAQSSSLLADHWKIKPVFKYYACGFCIALFLSNRDRLHHIDISHYRRLQTIREWNPNFIIRGLLLQPKISDCWNKISTHDVQSENLIWDAHIIAQLQSRLQISDELPDHLAADALSQSSLQVSLEPSIQSRNPLGLDSGTYDYGQDISRGTNFQPLISSLGPTVAMSAGDTDQLSLHSFAASQNTDRSLLGIPPAMTDSPYGNMTNPVPYNYPMAQTLLSTASTISPFYSQASQSPFPNDVSHRHSQLTIDDAARHSETSSWRSSSCTSTNTSIMSLPATSSNVHFGAHTGETWQASNGAAIFPPTIASHNEISHRKPPSIVAQLRRRLTRVKVKDPASHSTQPMDFDLDEMMRIMEHEEQSRAEIGTHQEVSSQ